MRASRLTFGLLLFFVPALLDAQTLSHDERGMLLSSLRQTDRELTEIVEGMTPAQWSFKPAEDRWSIAEVAEHILISERLVRQLIEDELMASPTKPADGTEARSGEITEFMRDRSQRFQAPDFAVPTGRWPTQGEFLKAWEEVRGKTIEFVEATELDLHGHTLQHPAFGMIDGNDWLTVMTSHAERHLLQIREVIADPNFPRLGAS